MAQGGIKKGANVAAKESKNKREKREAKVQGINKKPKKRQHKTEMQKITAQLTKNISAKIEQEMMAKLKKEGKPLHVLKDGSKPTIEPKPTTGSTKYINKKTLTKSRK
jgi:23S rRNA pseudoU1915 N3-methylase RlmH